MIRKTGIYGNLVWVLLFLILLAIFVLAVAPDFTVNNPANQTTTEKNFVLINVTVRDADNNLTIVRIYGINTTQLTSSDFSRNESLLYENRSVQNGTVITYNWTAPVLTNLSFSTNLLHFDNRSDFSENDTFVFDFSRNGTNATCSSTSCPLFNETGGKFAGAFVYDGIDDFFSIRNNAFKDINIGTIEAWISSRNTNNTGVIFAVKVDESTANDLFIFYIEKGRLNAGLKDGAVYNWLGAGHTLINNNTWHHIAVTVNSTGNFMFVDGIRQIVTYTSGSSTRTKFIDDLPPPPNSLVQRNYIGKIVISNVNQSFFNGTIDELAIYNKALTQEEVLDHARLRNDTTFYWRVSVDDVTSINTSAIRNVIIGSDWNRTPSDFGSVSCNVSTNASRNLTVKHRGLRNNAINITIRSDFTNTFYNETMPVNLTVNTTRVIEVTWTCPATSGSTTIALNITGTDDGTTNKSAPASLISTAKLIHTSGQPFLDVVITQPGNGTEYVAGQTDINLSSTVTNEGSGLATNVYLWFILPDGDWANTTGVMNRSVGNLSVGTNFTHSILVSIASNATISTRTIISNTSGQNESGSNLNGTIISGDTVDVTVISSSAPSAPGGEGEVGAEAEAGGMVTKSKGETIETVEVLKIVRGREETTPITISNIYTNSILTDIKVGVEGFMSQYVKLQELFDPNKLVPVETKNVVIRNINERAPFTFSNLDRHTITANEITPDYVDVILKSSPVKLKLKVDEPTEVDLDNDNINDIIITLKEIQEKLTKIAILRVQRLGKPDPEKIHFLEKRDYAVKIFAPPYLEKKDLELRIKITGNIIALDTKKAGFVEKPLTEYRNVEFKIYELSLAEVKVYLEKARKDILEMSNVGLPISRVQGLLKDAENALREEKYELAGRLAEQIGQIKDYALESDKQIREIRRNIQEAKLRGVEVPDTEKSLVLTLKAFDREDFETSLARTKETQLIFILETKGKVNILWFLKTHWWKIIIWLVILLICTYLTYSKLIIYIIDQRLNNLEKEEISINSLTRELQFKHLQEGSVSLDDYHRTMSEYLDRLNKIKQIRARLRNRRVAILRTHQEIKSLEKEKREVIGLMKKAQEDYLQKGTLSRARFADIHQADKIRLAEIEEETETLKRKLEKETTTKKHKILRFVDKIVMKMESWWNKEKIKEELKKPMIRKDKYGR